MLKLLAILLIGVVYTVANYGHWGLAASNSAAQFVEAKAVDSKTDAAIRQAFDAQKSNVQVASQGTVIKLLKDDNEGSRHQKFILKLGNGLSILIAHNIDLAPRIDDLKVGDTVEFAGEYEWSHKGGTVHWTHHDPNGKHVHGWLKHNEKIYQ